MKETNSSHSFSKLRNTLMLAFLALSLVPLTALALFFLHSHSEDLQEQSHSHLVSLRDTKQQQITDYIKAKKNEVIGFVHSELAYASGGRFYGLVNAFQRLGSNIEEARKNAQQRYITGSGDQMKKTVSKESENYIGSERYRLLHKRYHWAYLEYLKRSDFDDILLVDIDGNVTYSTKKDNNFGVNLLSQPFRETNLGQTFIHIRKKLNSGNSIPDSDDTLAIMSDFSLESGVYYAWFAAPVIQQGYLHSYALFRLSLAGITQLIEDHTTSANTLLVGSDMTPRSEHLDQISINKHKQILGQALNGAELVRTYTNSDNEKIIAAFTPVSFMGLNWALSVQLEESEAYARIHHLKKVFVIVMLVATALVVLASHFLANFITNPLLRLTWAAERVSAGDLNENMVNTSRKDEIGRLAISFERMQRSIREKIQTIRNQNKELEKSLNIIQQQNKELQQADKLKDEFLATTSHELHTPLHGMIGIAEALLSGVNGSLPASQKYQLEIIVNSGQRLSNLIDDLLDYHKMRYGHLDINKRATNLFNTTSLVIKLSAHLLENKRIRVMNQIPVDLPPVAADPQRLEQVLYNLIGNAIKFTHEGKVVISATALEHHIRVQIVDTGQGIPSGDIEYIFDPLNHTGTDTFNHIGTDTFSDTTGKGTGTSPYRQGAGLGLSISRQLIELMGGTLYVSSQTHIGTTFSFTLPLATKSNLSDDNNSPSAHYQLPEVTPLSVSESSALPQNNNGPLVLIADNDPVNLRVMKSFLALEGYRVKIATDGCEVLRLTEEDKPAIILLDIMMHGLNGHDICVTIRSKFSHTELPIIMLTTPNHKEDRTKGFESGANDFLIKPFNKQELIARVSTQLTANKAEKKQQENNLLQKEIQSRKAIESSLRMTQDKLLEQLDSAPEAIICINTDKKISFANQAASALFERTQEQLKRSEFNEVIVDKYTHIAQSHYCGEIEIFVGDERRRLTGDILKLPENTGIQYLFIFDIKEETDSNRLHKLETSIELLSGYAREGGDEKLEQLRSLGEEFTKIADKASGSYPDKQQELRELLVSTMTTALSYWENSTGTSKFEFAEQSGLWRVYLDRSTLQTRTLDKYLRVETLPKTPRWRTILNSTDYILEHCKDNSHQRKELEQLKFRLNKLLK